MNEKPNNFFDSRTLLAIVAVVGIIFGWQVYLSKKYPSQPVAEKATTSTEVSTETKQATVKNEAAIPVENTVDSVEAKSNKTYSYKSERLSFEINSLGMGFKNIRLNNYTDRAGKTIQIDHSETAQLQNTFKVNGAAIPFVVTQQNDNVFVGSYKDGEKSIEKTITVDPQSYLIQVKLRVSNFKKGVHLSFSENIKEQEGGGLSFIPSYENQSIFAAHGTTTDREILIAGEQPFEESLKNVSILSYGSLYFTKALIDKSEISPEMSAHVKGSLAQGTLSYMIPENSNVQELNYEVFFGPKDFKLLSGIDETLTEMIDFGFFSWIAKPLLGLMKFFYGHVQNYGWAIILMTLLVRFLLLPFNLASYRSMKKMQEIQPLIKEAKAKYKDDPKQLNAATMGLMKEHKVSPLGGCLPMLMQFPIFIALYSVLGQSIELYQEPFIFWIHDLSLKDPYYVLPVLMGITMFIQQKITPTAMDPAQAKVMMFMPIMFTFFMVGLPSGLTLYIFISTLFGILQQGLFLKDKKSKLTVATSAQ